MILFISFLFEKHIYNWSDRIGAVSWALNAINGAICAVCRLSRPITGPSAHGKNAFFDYQNKLEGAECPWPWKQGTHRTPLMGLSGRCIDLQHTRPPLPRLGGGRGKGATRWLTRYVVFYKFFQNAASFVFFLHCR